MRQSLLVIALFVSVPALAGSIVSKDCLERRNTIQRATIRTATPVEAGAVDARSRKLFEDAVTRAVDTTINAAVSETGQTIGYVSRVCDDTDPGQANCMHYIFDIGSKGQTRLVAIEDDWHTHGDYAVDFVCE